MLTGPPAGGAPSPTLGAGGVRGPRPLAYGLPTSVASFRARETKDEVPSHAVPPNPGLSRPFQAFPGVSRARMSFGSSFCPTHSRDHVLCESTGFGGSRALVPLLPRPYAHTGPLREGQALDRGPKASSGPGALQGEWSPPAPTPGPAWSPASEPGLPASRPGTGGDGGARGQLGADAGWDGGPLSGGHGLQLNRKPGAVCPGRRRRRERGIGGSSSTHARRPGPDICLF